jgi:hypothetical protein
MITEAARHATIENNKRRIARLVRLLREIDKEAGAHAQRGDLALDRANSLRSGIAREYHC